MKSFSIYSMLLFFIITAGLRCSGDKKTSKEAAGPLIPAVEAVQARTGSLPLTERLTGVVRAENQVAIYPQVNAKIVEVYVNNGDKVAKNQPLLKLRDTEFQEQLKQGKASLLIAQAQVRQAAARLQNAQSEFQRMRSLAEKNLTSASDLETAESQAISAEADLELAQARVEQAKATVDEREESLSHTIVRAPVAGSVGNRNAEVGMLVSSNTRLFTLGQLDKVRVQVVLTDRMLTYIEKGQRSEIWLEGQDGPLSAPLSRISPFLHPITHSTEAEIDIANPDGVFKSGMFVSVDIFYGESDQATLVPLSALYENPITGATGVYVNRESLDKEPAGTAASDQGVALTEPVEFEFVPVDIVARGRMSAGVDGVGADEWVVTIGQDLLAGQSGKARVRKVNWGWVEQLQQLQRQDLLKEVMDTQQAESKETTLN